MSYLSTSDNPPPSSTHQQHLQAQSQDHSANRYIPQSPKPDSPPQTPSPSSLNGNTGKATLNLALALDNQHVTNNKNNLGAGLLPTPPPTTESIMPSASETAAEASASTSSPVVIDGSSLDHRPQGTPEDYSYSDSTGAGAGAGARGSTVDALVASSSDSTHNNDTEKVESSIPVTSPSLGLAGMGINFPAHSNPLPAGLHSPERDAPSTTTNTSTGTFSQPGSVGSVSAGAGAGANGVSSIPVPIQHQIGGQMLHRTKSSEGTSLHANPKPSSTTSSTLHPSSSSYSTPTRPRSVSPRAQGPAMLGGISNTYTNSNVGANGPGAFASSSSIGIGSFDGPRERVISPNKLDNLSEGAAGTGISSSLGMGLNMGNGGDRLYDYSSAETGAGSANPYDPSHISRHSSITSQTWGVPPAGGNTFSAYGGNFPLTGKEAHHGLGSSPTVHPTKVPFKDSVPYWLGLYFCFNLGLTLFNKFVLVSFPFPYTLTGLHALSGCAGTYIALERGSFTPARLTQKENVILAAFSVLYTINIAVSNISLQLVSIPFHQVVRASTPLFTIFISAIFLRTKFSIIKLVSLLPVVAGVGFATYGDYDFTALGLILTLLGTFLAALKTVVTNLIQTGGGGRLRLHPLDLLMRMSPLAFIQCVIYGWYTGELERVRRYGATQMTRSKAIALLCNGIFAFGLNIVSFTANKKAGALTMTVSANCKQVLTIVLAVMLFNLHISPTNGVGILLTLVGGGWYGWVEYEEKKRKAKTLERA